MSYSSTLKMEEKYYSETSVDFQQITRHYIPEARTLLDDGVKFLGYLKVLLR
jgi:hypothetical protein